MITKKRMIQTLSFAVLLFAGGSVFAAPVLQLDILGGSYEGETVMAGDPSFTLYAYYRGDRGANNNTYNFTSPYYISATVTPKVVESTPPPDLGSFVWNSTTINVTSDMTFGVPPIEAFSALQGFDSQDLGHTGEYFPSYFSEFQFTWNLANYSQEYDTAEHTGIGPQTYVDGRRMYYVAFNVDVSGLEPGYMIHFDLYSTTEHHSITDIDILQFAPFSHDAQSKPVPEPGTLLLLGSGMVGFAAWGRKRLRK